MRIPAWLTNKFAALKPRQRQWLTLSAVVGGLVTLLWLILTVSSSSAPPPKAAGTTTEATKVTNVGVMAAGTPVTPLERWVGTAGKEVGVLKDRLEQQEQKTKTREEFEHQLLERFAKVEQQVASQSASANQPKPTTPPAPDSLAAQASGQRAPGARNPPTPGGMPPGTPAMLDVPTVVRVAVREPQKAPPPPPTPGGGSADGVKKIDGNTGTVDTYLPVSFTPGIMLGGLDAPTGGQAQSNPHPVLIRLEDNAFLPNQFRSNVRECFVIAAGYGDIASERAYLRTESLSCVRHDGSTIDVGISGVVYGEDGKVGVRGRLVTKQGQMLANALLAGLISGLGQGMTNYNSTVSSSAIGTISTSSGSDAFRAGMGSGVGRAMDRLANYYIKLAENTFPVIEVDAGRKVDVVITKGVRIQGGEPTSTPTNMRSGGGSYYQKVSNDEDY